MCAYKIPFNKPTQTGRELEYLQRALDNQHISGDGPFTRQCQKLLEAQLQVPRALLTTSCTHALEMAALLLELQPGDEVILPSFTFVSTANAFALRGARPVFIDIRRDTLNMDETRLEALISPYQGGGAGSLRRRGLRDADHPGDLRAARACPGRGQRPRVIRQVSRPVPGHFRQSGDAEFPRNQKPHQWRRRSAVDQRFGVGRASGNHPRKEPTAAASSAARSTSTPGSTLVPATSLPTCWRHTCSHSSSRGSRCSTSEHIWRFYDETLRSWADQHGVCTPQVPDHCDQAYHMYYLLMPDLDTRQAFIEHLKSNDILSVFHYQPLHLSAMGVQFGGRPGDCPVTEDISDRLVRLPFFTNMPPADQEAVIDAVLQFTPGLPA